MNEYDKTKIIKTYYSILILDSCLDIYEEMEKDAFGKPFLELKDACYRVLDMMKLDKELGEENGGKWYYRIAKHEEDNENDWQTIYKLYKYRGRWKVKVDEDF